MQGITIIRLGNANADGMPSCNWAWPSRQCVANSLIHKALLLFLPPPAAATATTEYNMSVGGGLEHYEDVVAGKLNVLDKQASNERKLKAELRRPVWNTCAARC